jgi:hypothetical protein
VPAILRIRLQFATMAPARTAAVMSTYLLIHGAWHGGLLHSPKYCRTLECNDLPVDRNGLGLIVSEAEREVEAIEAGMSLLADGEAVYREWRRIVT